MPHRDYLIYGSGAPDATPSGPDGGFGEAVVLVRAASAVYRAKPKTARASKPEAAEVNQLNPARGMRGRLDHQADCQHPSHQAR